MSGLSFSIKGLDEQRRRLRDERRGRVAVAIGVVASLFVLAGHERPAVPDGAPGVAAQPQPAAPAVAPAPLVAALAARPARLDFADQQVGTPGEGQAIRLTNTGTRDVVADYAVVDDGGHFSVTGCRRHAYGREANDRECELRAVFRPRLAGPRNARIAVFEVDSTGKRLGAALVTIDLAGRGRLPAPPPEPVTEPPRLEVTPTELDFSSPKPARQEIVARNGGAGTVAISATRLTGRDAGAFRVDADDCTERPLGAGEQCALTVTRRFFAAATLAAELQVQHTAADAPARVELRRTPAPVATVQADPDSLDFGSVPLKARSTRSVTVTNVGSVEARNVVTAFIGNSDSFQLGSNDCRGTLAPQASCTVEVVFAPAKAGLLQSGLLIAGTIVLVRGTGEAQGDPPPEPVNVIR